MGVELDQLGGVEIEATQVRPLHMADEEDHRAQNGQMWTSAAHIYLLRVTETFEIA